MHTSQRLMLVGCCLFLAAFAFCLGFLGNTTYVALISADPDRAFAPRETTNSILLGLGASVLSGRAGFFVAASMLRHRLRILLMVLSVAGFASVALLIAGVLVYGVMSLF